jgi:uncharacterized protein
VEGAAASGRRTERLTQSDDPLQPREASWRVIVLFLFVQTVLVFTLMVFRYDLLRPIGVTTNGLVAPELVAGLLLLLFVVGGIFIGIGRLRPRDIGLRSSDIPAALATTAAFWLVTQGILAVAELARDSALRLHPDWEVHGVITMPGSLIAMLLGMGLYQETAFRGFLFQQLRLKMGHAGVWLAAIVSQFLFALAHLPTRALTGAVTGTMMLTHMLVFTLAGLLAVTLYLRTRNLLVVVGIHALAIAPTPLVASHLSPLVVIAILTAALIARPQLVRRA